MQIADREEFEIQLAKLCAGYNVPPTPGRRDAYWTGLAKMGLAQFVRCVDFALSADGPEDLPTTKGIWKIYREMRGSKAQPQSAAAGIDTRDHLKFWANRLLTRHVIARNGLGSIDGKPSAEITACLKLKIDLVAWFLGPIREGDELATPAAFLAQWIEGIESVSLADPEVLDDWREMLKRPEMQEPFAPYMARELEMDSRVAA